MFRINKNDLRTFGLIRFLKRSLSTKIDYYKVLGVPKNASQKEIKNSYFKLAKKYHPDTNQGDENAAKKFQEVAIAYTVLSSQEKRQAYDEAFEGSYQSFQSFRRSSNQASFTSKYETFHSSINAEELFKKIFGTNLNDDHLKSMDREWIDYAATGKNYSYSTKTTVVNLSFREAAKGCEKIINAKTLTICEICMGVGSEPGRSIQLCPFCDGIGHEVVEGVDERYRVTCRFCQGKGHNVVHKCKNCLGFGKTLVERNLSIPVPAGIKDGEILKINVDPSDSDAYRGTVDKQSIFIQFKVEASDYFKVDGFDLHSSADISLPQAIFGGKILIDGLWSEEEITIEPGTDSHQTIKLAHKGLKDNERSSYGDHYVHLKILIPKKLSIEEDRLLREYASIETNTIGTINNIDQKTPKKERSATDSSIEDQERRDLENKNLSKSKLIIKEFLLRPIDDFWRISREILAKLFAK
ncbi:hypothetical protein NH340_JMT08580 [Sarcoptes scabiei]|nr:hypothetical protein NH340_JMT08580 [Sarcoptes scabiei]